MKTAIEAIEKIQKAAESASQETRDSSALSVGQVAHQGDVYLHRVPADWPRGKLLGTRKIAVGEGIGSHHIVEGEGVEVYEGVQYPAGFTEPKDCVPNGLLGPVVFAPAGTTLTHPSHAHHRLCGVYQVTYQFDPKTHQSVRD